MCLVLVVTKPIRSQEFKRLQLVKYFSLVTSHPLHSYHLSKTDLTNDHVGFFDNLVRSFSFMPSRSRGGKNRSLSIYAKYVYVKLPHARHTVTKQPIAINVEMNLLFFPLDTSVR